MTFFSGKCKTWRYGGLLVTLTAAFFVLSAVMPSVCFSFTESDLNELRSTNSSLAQLREYRDDEPALKAKLRVLDVINSDRARNGLGPLKLDVLASRVANKAALVAARGKYHGHWDLNGEKPYHRYAAAGGTDHVSENAYTKWCSADLSCGREDVLGYMVEGHRVFMGERPPYDGHRRNVLDPWHTHVGLGSAIVGGDFRYYEEYIDRYVELEPVPSDVKAGGRVSVSGRVVTPGFGAYYAIVYYEPYPAPMTPDEVNGHGSYPDYTDTVAAQIPYWEMDCKDNARQFSFSFNTKRKGLYYIQIFIKTGHTGKSDELYVSTEGLPAVSGIVVRAH